MIKSGLNKDDNIFSMEIVGVACGSMNTILVTNAGEVFVFGSNAYGQLARNPDEKADKD